MGSSSLKLTLGIQPEHLGDHACEVPVLDRRWWSLWSCLCGVRRFQLHLLLGCALQVASLLCILLRLHRVSAEEEVSSELAPVLGTARGPTTRKVRA